MFKWQFLSFEFTVWFDTFQFKHVDYCIGYIALVVYIESLTMLMCTNGLCSTHCSSIDTTPDCEMFQTCLKDRADKGRAGGPMVGTGLLTFWSMKYCNLDYKIAIIQSLERKFDKGYSITHTYCCTYGTTKIPHVFLSDQQRIG